MTIHGLKSLTDSFEPRLFLDGAIDGKDVVKDKAPDLYIEDANLRMMQLKYGLKANENPCEVLEMFVYSFVKQIQETFLKYPTLTTYILVFDHPSFVTPLKHQTHVERKKKVELHRLLVRTVKEDGSKEAPLQIILENNGTCVIQDESIKLIPEDPVLNICHLIESGAHRNLIIPLLREKMLTHPSVCDLFKHRPHTQIIFSCEENKQMGLFFLNSNEGLQEKNQTIQALWEKRVTKHDYFSKDHGEADILCFFWPKLLIEAKLCKYAIIHTIDSDFVLLGLMSTVQEWSRNIIIYLPKKKIEKDQPPRELFLSPLKMKECMQESLLTNCLFLSLNKTDYLSRDIVLHNAKNQNLRLSIRASTTNDDILELLAHTKKLNSEKRAQKRASKAAAKKESEASIKKVKKSKAKSAAKALPSKALPLKKIKDAAKTPVESQEKKLPDLASLGLKRERDPNVGKTASRNPYLLVSQKINTLSKPISSTIKEKEGKFNSSPEFQVPHPIKRQKKTSSRLELADADLINRWKFASLRDFSKTVVLAHSPQTKVDDWIHHPPIDWPLETLKTPCLTLENLQTVFKTHNLIIDYWSSILRI